MDDRRFDALSQSVARVTARATPLARLSRRMVLCGLAGGRLSAIFGVPEAEGKRKKRKGKKKKSPAPSKRCDPPCPGEKVCEDGVCRCPNDRNECRDDVCCGAGEICSGGQCAPCAPASCDGLACGTVMNACGDTRVCGTCGQNQVCHHGVCMETPCPAEHRVCDGECFPEAYCCSDAECVGNLRCLSGTCGCPDGRMECNGRCCGDREDCVAGVCTRFECEKAFPGLVSYCGPYPYNCCQAGLRCCNRVDGMINVCCVEATAICCAAPGGCCDRD